MRPKYLINSLTCIPGTCWPPKKWVDLPDEPDHHRGGGVRLRLPPKQFGVTGRDPGQQTPAGSAVPGIHEVVAADLCSEVAEDALADVLVFVAAEAQ
ncbi:MAG: hypothetical protein ABWY45_07480 [Mycobacterium sp.]